VVRGHRLVRRAGRAARGGLRPPAQRRARHLRDRGRTHPAGPGPAILGHPDRDPPWTRGRGREHARGPRGVGDRRRRRPDRGPGRVRAPGGLMQRTLFEPEHDAFRDTVRAFLEKEVVPHHAQWETDGIVPRELWLRAGELGLLGFMIPEEFGGGGVSDFRYNVVLQEELTRVGASGVGFALHTDLVSGYLLSYASEEQ